MAIRYGRFDTNGAFVELAYCELGDHDTVAQELLTLDEETACPGCLLERTAELERLKFYRWLAQRQRQAQRERFTLGDWWE